jgi:hypothetical protein
MELYEVPVEVCLDIGVDSPVNLFALLPGSHASYVTWYQWRTGLCLSARPVSVTLSTLTSVKSGLWASM